MAEDDLQQLQPVSLAKDPKGSQENVRILCAEPDGSSVVVKLLGKGVAVAQVELRSNSMSTPTVLGIVKHMVDVRSGRASLQAVCKQHAKCLCWISNTQNLELLLQWLAESRKSDRDQHARLCHELKRSIGMKVTT